MSVNANNRALHWVLKIGNLKTSLDFFQNVLGLRVLRHEEFDSGCEATCNGPYGGAWSKTMIGYGPEESNFALELTYNYGIESYEFGNDLQYIALQSSSALVRAAALGYSVTDNVIAGPDNYKYKIIPSIQGRAEQFSCVALRVSNLENSTAYWKGILGLSEFPVSSFPGVETKYSSSLVGFGANQTLLHLIEVQDTQPVNHSLSSGRIAFACQSVQPIFEKVSASGDVVQVKPLTLPTPGKADVVVTILQDRDGYEICFVEDVAFYQLAEPKYDVIDFEARAAKGGDGAPPPAHEKITHDGGIIDITSQDEINTHLENEELARVVLYFGAGWCKNCKKIAPFVEAQAKKFAEGAVFLSVDIAEQEDIALEYDVSNVPRYMIFTTGPNPTRLADYLGSSEYELKSLLDRHLKR